MSDTPTALFFTLPIHQDGTVNFAVAPPKGSAVNVIKRHERSEIAAVCVRRGGSSLRAWLWFRLRVWRWKEAR